MNPSKFIRSNILVTALSLTAAGINFLSQMVLAFYFGAQAERDAYFSALTVPAYIVALFIGSLSVVFLPYYVNLKKKAQYIEVVRLVTNTFGICLLFLAFIAASCFIFSEEIATWIAPGYSPEQIILTTTLFRILIFTVIFQSISSLLTVFYHVENKFFLPSTSPIIIPLASLLFVGLFHQHGIVSLAWGTVIGSCLSMMVLLPIVVNSIQFKHFSIGSNTNAAQVFRLALPLLVSGAFYRLTTIIERIIGSRLPSGSVSYLGYSSQLYLLLSTIASGSIAATFYPAMSAAFTDGNSNEFTSLLSRAIKLILLITFPIASVIIAIPTPIIEILFQRGAFDSTATEAVGHSLAIMMGAFIFASLGNVLVKVFYISNRTFIISAICILEVVIYAIVGYLLSSTYLYLGLAFALTASTGFTIFVCSVFLSRWGYISFISISSDLVKLLIAALACGVTTHYAFMIMSSFNIIFACSIGGLSGLIVYAVVVLLILKISDAEAINKVIMSYF